MLQSAATRAGPRFARRFPFIRRGFSTAEDVVSQRLLVNTRDKHHAVVQLAHAPANTIDMAMAEELITTVKMLEEDPEIHGFVLGSSLPGIYSAGLHLPDMLLDEDGKTDGLAAYWTAVQNMWITLYTTPLATVAALPGHCIAGGCMLSLACDSRVMVEGKGSIGLNEVTFGLVPPPWLSRMLVEAVGRREAEPMLQRGLLLPPDAALEAGLVDRLAPLDRLDDEAHALLDELLAVPDNARGAVKLQLREEAAEALREAQSEDLDAFVTMIEEPAVQEALRGHIASLGKKKKKTGGEGES